MTIRQCGQPAQPEMQQHQLCHLQTGCCSVLCGFENTAELILAESRTSFFLDTRRPQEGTRGYFCG